MSAPGTGAPPLRPCPFCGGPCTLDVERYPSGQEQWTASCDGVGPCGALIDYWATQEQAIAAWNRRVPAAGDPARARPKVVCLCGSTRFTVEMACIAWALERDEGYIVLGWHLLPDNHPDVQGPFTDGHAAENAGRKEHFDDLHKRKIDLADEVLVLNVGGYIGESTRSEIAYAEAHGKPVRYAERLAAPGPATGGVE